MLGIEMLAILSHEDGIRSVDSLSSEDVAVVIDFHWFTDCHLEAIFNMNASRESQSSSTVDGKDVRLTTPAFLTEPGSARYSSAPSITTVWSNYQTSYNDFFEVYITETVTLSPNIQTVYHLQTISRDHLKSVIPIHNYVNVQASVVGPQ